MCVWWRKGSVALQIKLCWVVRFFAQDSHPCLPLPPQAPQDLRAQAERSVEDVDRCGNDLSHDLIKVHLG